jgi:hypothetical protein
VNKENEFKDLKHSIRIRDRSGKVLIDIDKKGVVNNSDELSICVCKTIDIHNGWEEVELIYASEELWKQASTLKSEGGESDVDF